MRHDEAEIERAARRFEELADAIDPETAEVERTDDLREIADAFEAIQADEARLLEAVEVARARGRSWNHIAVALGVSRQAARQRFSHKIHPAASAGGLSGTTAGEAVGGGVAQPEQ